jgi:HNH endonuclease
MTKGQFSKLKDSDLVARTKSTAFSEREALTELLHLLKEVGRRRLHLEYGYGSLLEFAVKELGYDEASANRRIKAMQLISDIPEVEDKIKTGEMGLSVAATVQSFLRNEAKVNLKPVSLERKQEVLAKVQGKSLRDVQSELATLNPQIIPQDKERVLTEDKIEVKAVISKDLKVKLDRLKNLLSHKNPNMNFNELLNEVADIALERLDRTKQYSAPAVPQSKEPRKRETSHTRFIPERIKRKIWQRDRGRCTFTSPITKQKCNSQFQLQIDHITPFSQGGLNREDNLRLVCSNHNKLLATEILGKQVMGQYLSS